MKAGVAPDWSDGPVECRECGRPMRPGRRRREETGVWAGTVRYGAGGRCSTCYRRVGPPWAEAGAPSSDRAAEQRRRPASGGSAVVSAPAVGEPLTMRWRLPPGDEPLAHRELEALAALAGHLRERGLVLCARPQVRLTYGRAATITVSCRVRPAGGEGAGVRRRREGAVAC